MASILLMVAQLKPIKMKRFLCVTLSVITLTASATAQVVHFGIKAGIQNNFLILRSKSGGDWSRSIVSSTGFQAGGVADIGITNHFSIQPNLLFSMKSTRASSSTEITLYTIDLPVNFVYKHNGFFAGLGPNLSYGISAKQENGSVDDDLYEADSPTSPAEFNRFEFGANALLGYQFDCGLTLNAHYTPGYSNLNNDDNTASNQRYNTRIYGFSIGYMFGGKKPVKK